MPIPAFTAGGLLPAGIHDCTLDELRERFGQFQRTDARCRLFNRLEAFVGEARKTGFVVAIIVDGSFVTGVDVPNDIDIILVLHADHDFRADLRPFEYNVVSKRLARRLYGIDMLIAREGRDDLEECVRFFGRVRYGENRFKGMLRITL